MSKVEAQTYKNLGNQAFQAKNYQESIEHFTKAIECDPTDHVFYSNRSGAYASLEQYYEALEDAKKCVEINPNWSKGYVRKGLAEFYLQKFDDAIQSYTVGLQLDPSNQQLKEGLQRAEEEKSKQKGGANEQQVQQLLMKLLSNPKTAAYLQDQQFVQNLMAIQKNPALIPQFAHDPKMQEAFKVMFGLPDNFDYEGEAQKYGSQQSKTSKPEEPKQEPKYEPKYEPKQETKQQAPKQQAQLSEADQLKNKGNDHYKKREFEEALKYYDQALQLSPKEVLYYNNKAACYIEMGQYEEAHQECNKAIQIIEEENILDFNLKGKIFARKAAIYNKQKQLNQAIEYFNKSLLENNDPKVRDEYNKILKQKKEQEALDYINPEIAEQENEQGKEHFKAGQWADAMKKYDEAIKRNPKEPKYYGNKATCLMKLMEFAAALKLLDKQLEMEPNNVKTYLKKANCHQGLREYHKQMDCYTAGLKIDPQNQECKDGLSRTQMKMMYSNESKEEQEERARHAMADPEIQNILRDPEVMNIIRNLQENPRDPNILKALQDPHIGAKINKLIASGILKMG